ncbi:hypothetical protein EV182_006347, partial [Spiromyces aspiralis]
ARRWDRWHGRRLAPPGTAARRRGRYGRWGGPKCCECSDDLDRAQSHNVIVFHPNRGPAIYSL